MKPIPTATAFLAGALLAAVAFAQTPAPKRVATPDLAREARIALPAARATALAAVPGGRVQSEELEREKGRLIYSFDLKVGKKPGVEEVAVDAMTGKLIERKHESAKAEKAEARSDARKKVN